jgi:enterochelin esterase family protein
MMNNNQPGGMKLYQADESTLMQQKNNGYKLYWIGIGKDDFLYKNNVDYRAKLDSIGMKYEYRETDGGHIWKNWRIYLTEFLPLIFQ